MSFFLKFWGESQPTESLPELTEEEAFESFRTRNDAAGNAAEQSFEDYLQTLPPEKRKAARAFHELAKEKPGYYRQPKRSYYDSEPSAFLKIAVFGTAAVAASVLPVAIANSQYSEGDAQAYLEEQGYTNVQYEGKDLFLVEFKGCSNDDLIKFSFEAKGANGVDTQVMVCSGLFKAATIRSGN